ncbi:MAG: DPP IV N-terminal domain-containing protein, partial [Gemmatimonadota bacterium]
MHDARPSPHVTSPRAIGSVALALLLLAIPAAAQQRENRANWTLKERFSSDALRPIVNTQTVSPNWIEKTDSLWYYWKDGDGARFMLAQPKARTKAPLFDHAKLAAALSAEGGKPYDSKDLPFTRITFRDDLRGIRFLVDSIRYEWDLGTQTLTNMGVVPRDSIAILGGGRGGRGGGRRGFGFGRGGDFHNYSPDSTAFAFARDHNLFVVEVESGDTVQVSTDGVEDYSFGA